MSKTYHVSRGGDTLGEWSLDEILQKLTTQEVVVTDFVFDEASEDWIPVMQFPPVLERLNASKPKTPPKKSTTSKDATDAVEDKDTTQHHQASSTETLSEEDNEHLRTEWFVLKGRRRYGPFQYTDMIEMLQQKVLFEFDYTWRPGLTEWVRVAELSAFQHRNIEKLRKTLMPEISEVFFRRKHRRVQYEGTVLVNDDQTLWKGQGVELSSGGAGVVMEHSMIKPGEKLNLHFKGWGEVKPFTARCEVVSKKFVDGVKGKSMPIRYGLKFENLSEEAKTQLEEYSKHGVDAA